MTSHSANGGASYLSPNIWPTSSWRQHSFLKCLFLPLPRLSSLQLLLTRTQPFFAPLLRTLEDR